MQGTSLTLTDAIAPVDEKAGFGLRTAFNFSKLLAWDTDVNFFPDQSSVGGQRGGRAYTLLTGPKASWRWNRIAFFLEARPGVANFSNVVRVTTGICNGVPCFHVFPGRHVTHLALNLGGGLEVNTSRRTFLRFGVSETLLRYSDRIYRLPGTTGSTDVPGVVGNSVSVTAGLNYRLGKITDRSVSFERPRRWEIGGHFSLLSLGSAKVIDDLHSSAYAFVPFSLGDYPGIGGRVTYNFNRWLAIDNIVNFYFNNPNTGDAQRGGKILQGTFGPKAGFHTKRYGVFVKAQPGFLSYGAVHDNYFRPFPTQRLTHFAVEVGGICELYPSPRTMLRFDLGHIVAFYGPQSVLAPQTPPFTGNFTDYAFHDNGIRLTVGFGWRF